YRKTLSRDHLDFCHGLLGSLAFGVYYHYVNISPDHVAHLPPGDAQGLFRWTALALPAVEACAAAVGLVGACERT
ncbi:MAG: hypothetical protein ACE5GX_08800, partial [Thermoanaerobaculia bacterium]